MVNFRNLINYYFMVSLVYNGGQPKLAGDGRVWKTLEEIRFQPLKNVHIGNRSTDLSLLQVLQDRDQLTRVKFEAIREG